MLLDLVDLKQMHDKAYNASQTTRERGADDLVFYWITQWDDNVLNDSQFQTQLFLWFPNRDHKLLFPLVPAFLFEALPNGFESVEVLVQKLNREYLLVK